MSHDLGHEHCLQSFDKNELPLKKNFYELANNKAFLAQLIFVKTL